MNVSLIGLIALRAGLRLSALGLITAVLLMPPSQPTFARSPLVLVDFQGDTPGEPPATGDVGEPTYLVNPPGTSILVQSAANGIATQPAVLAAQDSSLYAAVVTHFTPVSEGVVRVEATVSVDGLAAGNFLETAAGSGPFPTAVVTRLYLTDVGKISVCAPGAVVGTYSANQPLRVRVDIDMSAHQWFVSVDNELDGFADDSRSWGLPFCNPVDVLPTVGAIWAGNALYPAGTALAYDDIEAALLAGTEAGPADHLAVSLQPANATVGTSIGTVDIAVRNQDDALVETDQQTLVTLSLIGSPGSLSCTGGVVRQVADGIATFEGCTVTAPGAGYQLQASASGLTSATSSTFEMTAPGPETGLLRVTTNPAVPSQVEVNGIPMDDWAINWAKMPPGVYTVSFSDLLGWSTPAPQTINVVADEVTTVQGDFVLKGNLRVITSPAVPSTITIDGIPRDEWGLWTDFPVGIYQVCFGPVEGFTAPYCQQASLVAGQTTEITGTFTPNPFAPGPVTGYGLLRVETSPAVPSQVRVNGAPMNDWAIGWLKLPPGTYTVSFGGVKDWGTPAPQVVTVAADQVTTVTANFTPRGWLRVITSPAVPATIFIDGLPREDWHLWTSFPADTYEVCLGALAGLVTPSCQTAYVETWNHTVVTGSYIPAPDVRVDSIYIYSKSEDTIGYRYTFTNAGSAPADMTKYVIQSWLSADAVLQKQTDVPAAGRVFDDECHSVPCPPRPEMMLPPGGWMTADFFADVSGQDLGVLKYLIAEVHSDAVVLELDYGNNWKAVPSWDLVSNVEVEWVNGDTATRVSWDFTPFPPAYLDHGFRVRFADTYDFYVGPGVREITKPIAETSWGLSCVATVYLLDEEANEVAQTTSENICSP